MTHTAMWVSGQDMGCEVDQHKGRSRPRLQGPPELEVGGRNLPSDECEVIRLPTRSLLQNPGKDAHLDHAVAEAEDLATWGLAMGRQATLVPARAGGRGEIQIVAREEELEGNDHTDHADQP